MAKETKLQGFDLVIDELLSKIGTLSRDQIAWVMHLVEDRLKNPLEATVTGSSGVISLAASVQQLLKSDGDGTYSNTYKRNIQPIDGQIFEIAASTIDVQTGNVTGDFFSPPTSKSMTASYFVYMGIEVRGDGNLHVFFGDEAVSAGAATKPPFSSGSAQPLIYILLEDDGSGGEWNFNNVLDANITILAGGGGGGAGSGGQGADLATIRYYVQLSDEFSDSDILSSNGTGIWDGANKQIDLEYDATKTFTVATNNITIPSSPSFTIAVGDIVIGSGGSKHTRINNVNSQTDFDVDDGSIVATGQVGLISQMAELLELTTYGDAGEKTRPVDQFGAVDIDDILVIYKDSAIEEPSTLPDVAYSACSGTKIDADNWSATQIRPNGLFEQASGTVIPNADTNLYVRFFANKGSGTGTVSLDEIDVFFMPRGEHDSQPVAWAAAKYDLGAGTWTTKGGGVPTISGSPTTFDMDFKWDRFRNVDGAKTQLFIKINGQEVFQEVAGVIEGNYSWNPVNNHAIQFNTDITSGATRDIEVVAYMMDAGSTDVADVSERVAVLENQASSNDGIEDLQKNFLKHVLEQEYSSEKNPEDGLLTELFLDHLSEDKDIETAINQIAQINGDMREAPFQDNIYDFFQKDRESEISPKSGILQPAYKPYYGEAIDKWSSGVLGTGNFYGIEWDETRRVWWMVDSGSGKFMKVSEDFSQALGWWTVDNKSIFAGVTVNGNELYVSDYNYGTYGRITKHTLSTDGLTIDSLSSGNSLPDTTSLACDIIYQEAFGLTNDGTHLYAVCFSTDNIGKITMSTFSSWDSSIDISDYVDTNGARSITYDGTDLFISDITRAEITKIKTDGSSGYNNFRALDIQGLTVKDGDLYATNVNEEIHKFAIKNARILAGQKIEATPGSWWDLAFVENLLDSGTVDGYIMSNGMEIAVYEADLITERTTGAIQTTTITDSSGAGTSGLRGIDYDPDTDKVIIIGNGSTNDAVFYFDVAELDGAYALQAGDRIFNFSTASNPAGVAKIPGESKVVVSHPTDQAFYQIDLAGSSDGSVFELPQIYKNDSETGAKIAFNPNNPRELFLVCSGAYMPLIVIDYPMSRYMGDGNQPYIVGILGYPVSPQGATFDANGNFVNGNSTNDLTYKLAVSDAYDKNFTGDNQRNVRYYMTSSSTTSRSYPGCDLISSGPVQRAIRYRRKYDPSVYSDQNNVLPLDGLYICGNTCITIIDLETNTEFMKFIRPEAGANYGMLDESSSGSQLYKDIAIIDDKLYVGARSLYCVDFINDTAYQVTTSGIGKTSATIKDRNLHTTASLFTQINTSLTIVNYYLLNVQGKQDTEIDPEYHNGSETNLDNGEIYLAYGTTVGCGLIKWKAGASYDAQGSIDNRAYITDSWSYVFSNIITTSGGVYIWPGDCRKVYADFGAVSWDSQIGTPRVDYTTQLTNRYISDLDIKTNWINDVGHDYVLVAEGQLGTSDTRAVDIIDVYNAQIEKVEVGTGSATGYRSAVWGKDNEIYGSATRVNAVAYLKIFKRLDFNVGLGNTHWDLVEVLQDNIHNPYWQFQDDVLWLSYSHDTLIAGNDDGCMLIEYPRQSSRYESKALELSNQFRTGFYIANDSSDYVGLTGKIRERVIKSDVNDTDFTFTNGSSSNWGAVTDVPSRFGGNYRLVLGQSGGGTQPKVEFTTPDNCTEIIIYAERNTAFGKVDINVANTSGAVNEIYDFYSAELVAQDIIVIKGLDPETHAVTITCRDDKNALSSNYNFEFQGYVAVVESAQDRAKPTITYSYSPDQDEINKHFDIFSTEIETQQLGSEKLFSGDGSTVAFQINTGEPCADVWKVWVDEGSGFVEKFEITDWDHDSAEQMTVTFDSAPPTGTDNIKIAFVRKGTEGKIRIDFDYPSGTNGLEPCFVNDLGFYLQKL